MRFCVTRTSTLFDDLAKPCLNAFRIEGVLVDERNAKHPDDVKYIGSKRWYSEGTNHRVENGHIKRDFPAKAWAVDIDGIDELIAFIEEYGRVVVSNSDESHFKGLPRIEIYDDYRE